MSIAKNKIDRCILTAIILAHALCVSAQEKEPAEPPPAGTSENESPINENTTAPDGPKGKGTASPKGAVDDVTPGNQIDPELPEASSGKPMSFEQAILAADKRNLTLASARLEVEKAKAMLSQVRGLILPIVQGEMQYMHNDHEDTVNFTESLGPLLAPLYTAAGIAPPDMSGGGDMVLRRQENLNGSLQVMLPIINLQSWCSIKTAKRGIDLAETSIESARQQLLFGVAQAYFFALMAKALIGLYEGQLRSVAHHLTTARERLGAGLGIRIDVIRAETDMEQARQRLNSSHKAFNNARDTLGHLTGRGGLPMTDDIPKIAAPKGKEDTLIENALKRRPDLKARQLATDLAERQLTEARMQLVPTLNAAWQGQYQFTEPAALGSDDRSRWAAILTLTVPIYNHFRYGDIDYKKASLRQAIIQADDAKSSAALEIRKAKRDYLDALSAAEVAQKQSNLANEALVLVEESYAAGTGSSLEVTDARRTASSADINLVTQQLKSQLALLSLLQATGEDVFNLSKHDKIR